MKTELNLDTGLGWVYFAISTHLSFNLAAYTNTDWDLGESNRLMWQTWPFQITYISQMKKGSPNSCYVVRTF